jgi:hypothetical protein
MNRHASTAVAGLCCVLGALWLAPSATLAQEPKALARQFMRCTFVISKMSERETDKAKAERASAASAMFTLIGAKNAAGTDFIQVELPKAAEAFVRELKGVQKKNPSPQALDAFLREENARCGKLLSEHRARYFAR